MIEALIEELKALDGLSYVNDDGEPRRIRLRPPLTGVPPAEIPELLRQLLKVTQGLEGVEHVSQGPDFSGGLEGQFFEEFSPQGVCLATDQCGNSWTLDPATGWVFYLCHDAPVVVYQFPGLLEFLQQFRRQPAQSDFGTVLQNWVSRIWRENPGCLSHDQALLLDAELANFARELAPEWTLIDLRKPAPGDGFSWGRYGPDTEVRRHPSQCIVAVRKPAKKPSFWSKFWPKA